MILTLISGGLLDLFSLLFVVVGWLCVVFADFGLYTMGLFVVKVEFCEN